jgi:hypothetical protein
VDAFRRGRGSRARSLGRGHRDCGETRRRHTHLCRRRCRLQEVLIHVRHGAAVIIDRRAPVNGRIGNGCRTGCDLDAWLQDGVPVRTRPAASNSARFSGCASVPTRRASVPRGKSVSASSVTT